MEAEVALCCLLKELGRLESKACGKSLCPNAQKREGLHPASPAVLTQGRVIRVEGPPRRKCLHKIRLQRRL